MYLNKRKSDLPVKFCSKEYSTGYSLDSLDIHRPDYRRLPSGV